METTVSYEYLASKAFPRDTRETFYFINLYYLIQTFYTHKCWGVLLRENPSQTPWELEIIIPIYLYTYACGFPQLLPLHFHTIERLIVQTLTTAFQSVKWDFGAARKHWKKPRMADATWSLLWDPKSKTRHSFEKPCWSRSLEGLGTVGWLGLEGLLLTYVSQLIV